MNVRAPVALVCVLVVAAVTTAAASPSQVLPKRVSEQSVGRPVGGRGLRAPAEQVLVFVADASRASTSGPSATQVGHGQHASGVVRDANGHRLGRFSFTCIWVKIIGSDALEHCAAQGSTPDGQLRFSGPARERAAVHTWHVSGGTGRYVSTHGTVTVRDLSEAQTLLTVTLTRRSATTLRSGVVTRPPGNDAFIARADITCAAAAAHVHELPEFPFSSFDPNHPSPTLLPKVGAYFTGPGDPRHILSALDEKLEGMGDPPVMRAVWQRLLAARVRTLAVINEQDHAALTKDVTAFIKTLAENTAAYRAVAINSAVFGATACVF